MEYVNKGAPFSLIGPLQIQEARLPSRTGTLRVRSQTLEIAAVPW